MATAKILTPAKATQRLASLSRRFDTTEDQLIAARFDLHAARAAKVLKAEIENGLTPAARKELIALLRAAN